jgi:hypothetical protein
MLFTWSLYLCRRRPTLPHTFACSTIGPAGLNFRVRDGNGCFPCGKITGFVDVDDHPFPRKSGAQRDPVSPVGQSFGCRRGFHAQPGYVDLERTFYAAPGNRRSFVGLTSSSG